MHPALTLAAALSLLIAIAAHGQDQPPATQETAAANPTEGRVPVPEPSAKAISYYHSGHALWLANKLADLLIPAVILFTGFSARIRSLALRLGRYWFFTVAIYFLLYLLLNFLVTLPLSWAGGYFREHAYGLSNQTAAKWLGDSLKGLLVGAIIGSLVIWVPYWFLHKSPRRWWLYTGLLSLPFLLLMMLIAPIWIAPLFNNFGPMQDKALEAKILALADRAGIASGRVFEVDMSTDTKKVNAYVVGVGSTKRIVLWDTLLAKANDDEVLFIMGHEMGHYVLGHIWQGILLGTLGITLILFLIHRSADWLLARFHHRFGFSRLSDIASLPLLLFLFALAEFLSSPIALAWSRSIEHEADRFGLEITQNNHAAATAFAKLQVENLGVPRPSLLHKIFLSTHPPVGERIDFCNDYHPWSHNQPLLYGKYFREPKAKPPVAP